MVTILEILDDFAPELSSVDTATKLRFIDYAKQEVSTELFSSAYNKAVAVYAAHLLTQQQSNSGSSKGDITSEREGDLEKRYSSQTTDKVSGSTKYLDIYAQMVNNRAVSGYFHQTCK